MPERIDHAVIYVGPNLDEAAEQYTRLGFQLTPRGHHSLGSSNHLAIFGTNYFELLGVEPRNVAKFGHGWDHPTGLSGLVFKTDNATQLWRQLAARGVPLEGTGPNDFYRPVDLPDHETHNARFRTLRIAADRIPNGRVFFCQHLTPELVWRPEWQTHANGVTGLSEYVYSTPDPARSAAVLDQAFGPGVLAPVKDGLRLQAGPASVFYLFPKGVTARYGTGAAELVQGKERAVALALRTDSLERVRNQLRRQGVKGVQEIGGRIIVPPEQAAGVCLAFQEK